VITRGDLSSAEMVSRFVVNKESMWETALESGPYIYSVQADRLARLFPPPENPQRHNH
jgi:hypothetical protein